MSVSTISLIESLLLHDRPAAWWGLDTADPLTDDAVFGTSQMGYTLTAIGTPSNAASLHTRGDTGASGCRDFNGTTGGYWTAGSVTKAPEGPPAFHAAATEWMTSASPFVTSPAGIQVGDLLILIAVHPTAGATVTTPPSGFTLVGSVLNCTTHTKAVYRKTAVTSDTVQQQVALTWNSSAGVAMAMLVYRGCDSAVANLIFDSGEQVTTSDTFHFTTTETYPDGARQLVIWTKNAVADVDPDALERNDRASVANGDLQISAVDYKKETAGSQFRVATTTAATNLGVTLITFGAPRKVVNDVLDTITGDLTIGCLINPDTVAAGSRTIVRKEGSWLFQVDAATVKFYYHDGTSWRSHSGPTLSAGTTYRLWVRDDGSNITFWVNGTKSTVARFNALPYATNTNRVTIAHFWNGSVAAEFFDGRIDELAIFTAPFTDQMVLTHHIAATQGTFGSYLQANKTGAYPRSKLELAVDSNPTDRCHSFADISLDIRHQPGIAISRERNDPLDRHQAGTMSFTLDNRDRAYDDILPRRVVRFRAQVSTDGPVIGRFFGYTEAPSFQRPEMGKDSTVSFTATDVFKALSLNKVQETFVRPQELAGERLEAVLEHVGGVRWSLDPGHHLLDGVDLQGVSALEHAQSVAETDGGALFADALGVLRFHDNQHRAVNEQALRATYGWVDTSAPMPAKSFAPEVDESRLYTAAAVTPASGNVQRAENAAAAAQFFPLAKEVSTLHASDSDALAMAHHIVNVYSVPLKRVRELVLQPSGFTSPATMWTVVLGHEVGHRIRTIEKPIGGGEVAREHFIEGIAETITVNDWQVTFQLSPTELEGSYFVIGTDQIGDTERVIGW